MGKFQGRSPLVALLAVALTLGLSMGCYEEADRITNPPPPAPPEPEPVSVTAAGGCEVEPGSTSINCVDNSTSVPAGQLAQAKWTLRRGSATVVISLTKAPGAAVSFGPGLAAGTYAVDLEVTAVDGQIDEVTFTNLVVGAA